MAWRRQLLLIAAKPWDFFSPWVMSPMKGWLGSPPGVVTVVELGFQLAEMAGPVTGGLQDVGFDWSGLHPPRISACGVGIFVGHRLALVH